MLNISLNLIKIFSPKKVIILVLLLQSFLLSATYYVDGIIGDDDSSCDSPFNPCETVGGGIDRAVVSGDVVIVAGGTYQENLFIQNSITLKSADAGSPAIIDGNTPSGTIITGSNGLPMTNHSCIIVQTPPGINQRINPVIKDLIIKNGRGSKISGANGTKKVGGGILVFKADLTSKRNKLVNNGLDVGKNALNECKGGGGGGLFVGDDGLSLGDDNENIAMNTFDNNSRGSTIKMEKNIFSKNKTCGGGGKSVQAGDDGLSLGDDNENIRYIIDIDFDDSTFDVAYENGDSSGVSEYWVMGSEINTEVSFDFTTINAELPAILTDVWVDSVNGTDADIITGTPSNPFQTVDYAQSRIFATENNPITIHLVGPQYGVIEIVTDYVIVDGGNTTSDIVILDACTGCGLSNITIDGEGIVVYYAEDVSINNIVSQNSNEEYGGIWIVGSDGVIITGDSRFQNNERAGLLDNSHDIKVLNSTIINNDYGFDLDKSDIFVERVLFTNNNYSAIRSIIGLNSNNPNDYNTIEIINTTFAGYAQSGNNTSGDAISGVVQIESDANLYILNSIFWNSNLTVGNYYDNSNGFEIAILGTPFSNEVPININMFISNSRVNNDNFVFFNQEGNPYTYDTFNIYVDTPFNTEDCSFDLTDCFDDGNETNTHINGELISSVFDINTAVWRKNNSWWDPNFNNFGGNDFTLADDSQCIDAGEDIIYTCAIMGYYECYGEMFILSEASLGASIDQWGMMRYDIGAFEHNHDYRCSEESSCNYYSDLDGNGHDNILEDGSCYSNNGYNCDEDCTASGGIDDCDVCGGGNSARDCNADCFGGAVVDNCGDCVEIVEEYNGAMDCDGECDGEALIDECGYCGGDGSSCGNPGCTDIYANNQDFNAIIDDGSCSYSSNGDYSLEFDGNDVVRIDDHPKLDFVNKGTIALWMKPNGTDQDMYAGLVAKTENGEFGGNQEGISYYIAWLPTYNILKAKIGNNTAAGNSVAYNNLEYLSDGNWHYIAFTFNGEHLKLYIDGTLENTADQTIDQVLDLDCNLKIAGDTFGDDSDQAGGYFRGSIDNLVILKTDLNQEQILYVKENNSISSDWEVDNYISGYWSFNQSLTSNIAIDYSGNLNHGTIYGATYSECNNDNSNTGFGCACGGTDIDADNDGICDSVDNCTDQYNPNQEDYDGDSIGDECDLDDDNDGALDYDDSDDNNEQICNDSDGDGCDDCSQNALGEIGIDDPLNDGWDYDHDGICDQGDVDDDNDDALDEDDSDDNNQYICSDNDSDGCDDCFSGIYNISNDGPDDDNDGICDDGDDSPDCDGYLDECGLCNGENYCDDSNSGDRNELLDCVECSTGESFRIGDRITVVTAFFVNYPHPGYIIEVGATGTVYGGTDYNNWYGDVILVEWDADDQGTWNGCDFSQCGIEPEYCNDNPNYGDGWGNFETIPCRYVENNSCSFVIGPDAGCDGLCFSTLEEDACGVCSGDNSSCTGCTNDIAYNYDIENIIDDGTCIFNGDVNMDYIINVVDVVMMVGLIMNQSAPTEDQFNLSDINGDGLLNVADVVMVIQSIMGNHLFRGKVANSATIYFGNGIVKIEADGNISGIEMKVSGDFAIINTHLPVGWEVSYNESIILFFSMDGSRLTGLKLFEYEGELLIHSTIVADWHGSVVSVSNVELPREFALLPAYPNPFNPITSFSYSIPEDGLVHLVIYDIGGRIVSELVNEYQSVGTYPVIWNAQDLSSGIYIVHMIVGKYSTAQKVMLIK